MSIVGTVTIDPITQAPSGTGLARALYNAIVAEQEPAGAITDPDSPPKDWHKSPKAWSDLIAPYNLGIRQSWAREANAHAQLLAYLQGSASISVTIPAGALGAGLPAGPVVLTGTLG